MRISQVMCIVFGLLSLVCIVYYIIAASYAGAGSSFLSFWLAAFAGFLVLAVFFYFSDKRDWMEHIPKAVKVSAVAIFSLGILLFAVLEGMIISRINSVPEKDVDYLVVLGAQVRGTKVTKSLAGRLDAALEYAKDHEDIIIIVSGGQGTGEDISEAEAMKKYLVKEGFPDDRIIMEDKSTTTKENLIFSREKMNTPDASVGVVTNNFHVYRAMKLAEKLNYKDVQGLAGRPDKVLFINYMVREAFAILKEYLVGNI